MTVDLLSVKLKEAKRELNNLKTAHLRGLGMLRIYKNVYSLADLGIEDDYSGRKRIVINFSTDFAPYPLMVLVPQVVGTTAYTMSVVLSAVNFSSGGYTLIVNGRINRWDEQGLTEFSVISSAPIVSLNLEEYNARLF